MTGQPCSCGLQYLNEPTWTDGDAVAGAGSTVLTRMGGKWHQVTEHGVSTAYDADVSGLVADGTLKILRRQVL